MPTKRSIEHSGRESAMKKKAVRVVHYLNQFFGGVGGEDKADMAPQARDGSVGPGRAVQQALGDEGDVVAAVICGDNYFAQRIEHATDEVMKLVSAYRPDALIAGPAFFAGRYGVACGAVCKAAQDRLGIPTVTGMYKENPGVDLFHKDVYIVETGASAAGMTEIVSKMTKIVLRLIASEEVGKPSQIGYFPRGILVNEVSDQTVAQRAVSMMLAKLRGETYETEVPLPSYERVEPATGIKNLLSATVALVTDGGLVPKGNPDKIESERATHFGRYSIEGMSALDPDNYQAHHAGYTPFFVNQNPHRLVPVDVMRDLEKEGKIGKLYNFFLSTSGCASILEYVKRMGKEMAKDLTGHGVQCAILTST
jgi:betaine reductase